MVIGVIVVAAFLVTASQAEAWWGWGCGWGGYRSVSYYTPYYASWCSPCYTSCYSGGCGWGRGWGAYRWSYSSGCCYNSCSTGCTTVGSCCGNGSVITTEPATTQEPTVAPPQQQPPAATSPTTSFPTRANSGLLTVWVPAGAKVFINGKETTTQGSRRRYVSYGLQPGLTYKYELRAELVRNGMIAEENKTVYMAAGVNEGVAFGFNREPSNQIASKVQ